MQRQPKGTVIIGAPGTGKSTFAAKLFEASPYRNGLIYMSDLQVSDKAFLKYPHIDIDRFRGGKVKITDDNIEFLPFVKRLLNREYLNQTILFDDTGYFLRYQLPFELHKLCNKRRHLGLDLIFMFHGCSECPIELAKFMNYIVLFHTTDNFQYKGQKIAQAKALEAAQKRLAERFGRYPDGHPEKYRPEIIRMM